MEMICFSQSELRFFGLIYCLSSRGSRVDCSCIILFGCFGRKIDGPGLPGGLIIYKGLLFPLKRTPMPIGRCTCCCSAMIFERPLSTMPCGFLLGDTWVHSNSFPTCRTPMFQPPDGTPPPLSAQRQTFFVVVFLHPLR